MEKKRAGVWQYRWKDEVITAGLLLAFGFMINAGIEIRGLVMDDLYLWSCYGEQTFREFVFPLGSTRFRFLYYLAAYVELGLLGSHVTWFVPVNIIINSAIAYTLCRFARTLSGNNMIGFLSGFLYLLSRMSYYQISQVYGLMESLALWAAIGILYCLYKYINEPGQELKWFWTANGLYFAVCFIHERYMALLPLLFVVLLIKRNKQWRQWVIPMAVFGLVQLIRLATIGTVMPAGTGGTDVADTLNLRQIFLFAIEQVLYLFGINTGGSYLSALSWQESSRWIKVLVVLADMVVLAVMILFVIKVIRGKWERRAVLRNCLLFFLFIGACIACSSVTIRVEMRWVYVSYTAALLFMSWMYGVLTVYYSKNQKPSPSRLLLILIAAYGILMVPVETHYRSKFPMLYYWGDQHRYNSLAQETYGLYGDDIYGKTIYVIGDNFHLNDFCAENFFRVFDKENRENCIEILHVEDIRDIGTITNNMLVIQEDLKNNRFHDVTNLAKDFKCRSIYGYYDDNWIDEQARIQVMAGKTGKIDLTFTYPIAMDPNVTYEIMVYKNHQQEQNVKLTENIKEITIESEPYELVTLDFQTSFCIPGSNEKRGKTNLAIFLEIAAD